MNTMVNNNIAWHIVLSKIYAVSKQKNKIEM